MSKFKPHIIPVYPAHNFKIFEEWFAENYTGCNTDRELLPFFPTSYWVNNDYGNDQRAKKEAQDYIDSLPRDKKYTIITQYDDGVLIEWNGLDVLEFNMSKNIGVEMPLICQPHPYTFTHGKKWFASFVGSRTHPLRDKLEYLKDIPGYYISFEPHNIQDYCRIMHESMFALCPRGYGANSFRTIEAIQYGAIPVYISDEWIDCFDADFNDFGVLVHSSDVGSIDKILQGIDVLEVVEKQELLPMVYDKYYSYNGAMNQMIKALETEYNNRGQG